MLLYASFLWYPLIIWNVFVNGSTPTSILRILYKNHSHPSTPVRSPQVHRSVNSPTCRKQDYNERPSFTEPAMLVSILPGRSSGSGLLSGQPFFSLEWNTMNKNVSPEATGRVTSNAGEFPVRKGTKGSEWNFTGQLGTSYILYFFNVLGHLQLTLELLI